MIRTTLTSVAASALMIGVAAAQTTTGATTSTSTPGIPNTGAGDVLGTSLILLGSILVAIAGAIYLYASRSRKV